MRSLVPGRGALYELLDEGQDRGERPRREVGEEGEVRLDRSLRRLVLRRGFDAVEGAARLRVERLHELW